MENMLWFHRTRSEYICFRLILHLNRQQSGKNRKTSVYYEISMHYPAWLLRCQICHVANLVVAPDEEKCDLMSCVYLDTYL